MPNRPDPSRSQQIAALVSGVLSKYPSSGPVAPDAELSRLGLTSIDMVELMLAVEGEFDVTIPPTDITLDNFHSVAAIERLVGHLSGAKGSEAAAA